MGSSSSKPEPKPEPPKGPADLPDSLKDLKLEPARCDTNPLLKNPPVFKNELPARKIELEFARQATL